MTANYVPAPTGVTYECPAAGETVDPTRAPAGVARWRRSLAEALGSDPGARLDRPDRRLTMLRIFGSTRRLAELCLKHPTTAADAMTEGASAVLAGAARDIAALAGGVGGADAVYTALAPLKNRADIAIAVAELSGEWTTAEAGAARADFAERIVETALAWLVRGAVNRGELAISVEESPAAGVFALAGADLAHEDLSPMGPLEVLVIYDGGAFDAQSARMAERAFVRIAAEFKEAIEGKTGDYPLYWLRNPLGSGVGGLGFAESQARVTARIADAQQDALRAWIATSRVVAGDRRAGGVFLESVEEAIWTGAHAVKPARILAQPQSEDDPRAPFRTLADLFRHAFGASRPVFRSAAAGTVFETAAASGALPRALARRLVAGDEFAQGACARLQMLKGSGAFAGMRADEVAALARLFGFLSPDALKTTLAGYVADARNALNVIANGPLGDFENYKSASAAVDDVDKLEDLGFIDGFRLSGLADSWAGLAGVESGARFSAIAPGLLTAFGETQRPDQAVKLFDLIVAARGGSRDVFVALAKGGPVREGLVDALGCFGEAAAPLAASAALAEEFFEERGRETPETGAEWISRFGAPETGADLPTIGEWRRENIARAALCVASGVLAFDVAADVLGAIDRTTLAATFERVCTSKKAGAGLAMHVLETSIAGLPGAPTPIGFIASNEDPDAEDVARGVVEALSGLAEGLFAVSPDVSRRPGGPQGGLAPSVARFKAYAQSEAIAADQIMLARAVVIAGRDDAQDAARKAVRCSVSGAKRAEMLLRDIDRARAQRLRRDKAGSEWDVIGGEGALGDVDLIIGTLVYKHGAALPALQTLGPDGALDALARAGLLPQNTAATLKSARSFWTRLATARALARWSDPQREPVRSRFGALLARAAAVERFALVRPLMRGYAEEVTRLYAQLVLGRPASGLAAAV